YCSSSTRSVCIAASMPLNAATEEGTIQVRRGSSMETSKALLALRAISTPSGLRLEYSAGSKQRALATTIITGLRSYPYAFSPNDDEVDVVVPPPFQGSRTQSPSLRP